MKYRVIRVVARARSAKNPRTRARARATLHSSGSRKELGHTIVEGVEGSVGGPPRRDASGLERWLAGGNAVANLRLGSMELQFWRLRDPTKGTWRLVLTRGSQLGALLAAGSGGDGERTSSTEP